MHRPKLLVFFVVAIVWFAGCVIAARGPGDGAIVVLPAYWPAGHYVLSTAYDRTYDRNWSSERWSTVRYAAFAANALFWATVLAGLLAAVVRLLRCASRRVIALVCALSSWPVFAAIATRLTSPAEYAGAILLTSALAVVNAAFWAAVVTGGVRLWRRTREP